MDQPKASALKKLTENLSDIRGVIAFVLEILGAIALIKNTLSSEPNWVLWLIGLALILGGCLFLNLRKKDIGTLFQTTPSKVPYYSKKIRVISSVVFVLFLLSSLVVNFGRNWFKDAKNDAFTVLVADFEGPVGYGVTEIVIEDLRKVTKQFPSIKILSLGTNISAQQGNEFARRVGTESNADVVIWGWYRKSTDKVFVTFHFEKLTGGHDEHIPTGERTKIAPVTDLEHFTVQRQLSAEMTPIALLLGALWKIEVNAFSDAHALLTTAITSSPPSDVLPSIYFYRAWSTRNEISNKIQENPNSSLSNIVSDLTKAIELETNFLNAYINRSSAYLQLDLGNEALADCEEALRRDSRHHVAFLNKSTALAKLKRFDEALACVESAFKLGLSPQAIGHCHAARAAVYADAGNHQKAIEDYTHAIALVPELAEGMTYNRGISHNILKEYDKALRDFTRVVELQPLRAYPRRQRANCYANQGKWKLAIKDYDQAIARWPKDAESYLNRGLAHRVLGQIDQALSDIQRAQELDTSSALASFHAGLCFLIKSNFAQASTNFSKAIQSDNSLSDAYAKRGIVRLAQGELSSAVQDFTEALNGNPSDLKEVYLYRGQAYFVLREDAKAVTDFEKVLNLNPEVDSKYVVARLNLAQNLSAQENYKDAAAHLEKIIEVQPTNVLAFYSWGVCLREMGRNEDALNKYDEAIKIDPKLAFAWHAKGIVTKEHFGNCRDAIDCFEKAYLFASNTTSRLSGYLIKDVSQSLIVNALLAKGDCLARLNRHTEAILCFSNVVQIEPQTPGPYANWANSLVVQGRSREADKLYEKSVSLGAKSSGVFKAWGLCNIQQGLHSNAVSKLEKAVSLDPTDGYAWLFLADALAPWAPKESLTKYRRASQLLTNDYVVHFNFGNTLMNMGELPEAEEKYRRAVSINANASDAHRGLGMCLWRLKRYDDAQVSFERSVQLDPKDGLANWHLGLQYASNSESNKAALAFEAVVKWHADTEIGQQAAKTLGALRAGGLTIQK